MNIEYHLHRDDTNAFVITSVGGDWDRIALESGAEQLRSKYIAGTNVTRYVVDDETRDWLANILNTSLAFGQEVRGQYRCDTPTKRRLFLMAIRPAGRDSLCVSHSLIHAEHMTHRVHIRYGGHSHHTLRCSLCNSVLKNKEWIDPFDLGEELDINVKYRICSGCMYAEHTQHLFDPVQHAQL